MLYIFCTVQKFPHFSVSPREKAEVTTNYLHRPRKYVLANAMFRRNIVKILYKKINK